jgi:hypothetical protein
MVEKYVFMHAIIQKELWSEKMVIKFTQIRRLMLCMWIQQLIIHETLISFEFSL